MMTTKIEFNIDKKGEFQTSLPAVNGQRFICAGERCITKDKCARWNGIYKENVLHRNN
jgi:hypothetical protein